MSPETLTPETDAEKTVAPEAPLKKPSPYEILTENVAKKGRESVENTCNEREILDILQDHISEPMFDDEGVIGLLADRSKLTPETLGEALGLIRHLEACISTKDIAKISEMAKQKESNKAIEKKKQIITGLAMPVIKGHLTAGDVQEIVKNITLFDPDDTKTNTRSSAGYEGLMLYDREKDEIKISIAVFANEHKTDDGRTILLDAEHMATHELSHGVVNQTVLQKESIETLGNKMTAKDTEHTPEIIKQVRILIESAEEIKDFQSMHIKNVLDSIKNIDKVYAKFSAEQKEEFPTAESYRNHRLTIAATEIITEYTALYLESNGSSKDFVRNCLERAKQGGVENGLALAFKAKGESDEEAKTSFPERFNKVIFDLYKDEKTPDVIMAENPGLKKIMDSYTVFYTEISKAITTSKGELNGESADEFDWDMGYGGYCDGYGGFGAERGQGGKSQGNDGGHGGAKEAVLGLVSAFAESIDVTEGMK